MTTSAAIIALTYGGQDVQDLDGIFLELVRGLAEHPSMRGMDTIVPRAEGRTRRNRVGDVLTIELRGWVRGAGMDEAAQRADFATNRLAFRTLFDPRLGDQELVATLEDGSTATISAAATERTVWNQQLPSFHYVSVELDSVAPDWVITPAGS